MTRLSQLGSVNTMESLSWFIITGCFCLQVSLSRRNEQGIDDDETITRGGAIYSSVLITSLKLQLVKMIRVVSDGRNKVFTN